MWIERNTNNKESAGETLNYCNGSHVQDSSFTPIIFSFDKFGNNFMSTNDVATPSRVPNCESMPRVNNIKKNNTAQNCAPGN